MRVFVTGATGFIGSAIVKELLGAGHHVIGMARSDEGAKAVTAMGAEALQGTLEDVESMKKGATGVDGVIHCAFIHDFTKDFHESVKVDQRAIEAMGSVLAGSNKPLLVTTGVFGLPPGRPGTEDDSVGESMPRKSEAAGLALASQGIKGMSMRMSPSVHGDGDHGFVPAMIKTAREKGRSIYIGEGKNRWPAVHRLDAAKLYRLAVEKGAAGARYHGVADEGIATREIAEVIARRLNVPAVSVTQEEASQVLGFIGWALGLDGPASSKLTQERLGWKPTHPGLIEDLEKGTYFDT